LYENMADAETMEAFEKKEKSRKVTFASRHPYYYCARRSGPCPRLQKRSLAWPAPTGETLLIFKFSKDVLIPIRIQAASALAASSAPQLTASKPASPLPCRLDVILNAKWN
jgi:hypothetical protein